jgi:hypothetical protein
MTDSNFLQEIQEDLDRQKLEAIWKRYGGLAFFGAIVVIVATATMSWWHAHRDEENQRATAQLIEADEHKLVDADKQIDALENFAKKNDGVTQAAFARFHAAALAVDAGKKERAIQLYDSVASDSSLDGAFRQFADLLAVQVQMDGGDPAMLQKRLQPLESVGAPWRFSAMEFDGHLALRAGDKVKAKTIFTELAQNAAVPQSLSSRAADVLRYIGE